MAEVSHIAIGRQHRFGDRLGRCDPRQLSKASYRKMKQNRWWAARYKLISVPLTAGVLAPILTVVVALNA